MTTRITTSNIDPSSLETIGGGPKITSIGYPGTETAISPAGGETITINGTGFKSSPSVIINGVNASVVSYVSSSQITFTAPAMSVGTYIIYLVNTDGGTAIAVPGISYSGTPAWTTAAGSIGTQYETVAFSQTVAATGDAPVTYSLVSGTLPPGSTLNADGTLTGTSTVGSGSVTTYTFTINALDAQNQPTPRTFTITINPDVVTWSTPSLGAIINLEGSSYTQSLTATSAAGKSISYTANALPTGLTLSSGVISGTPTVEGTISTLLTATAADTARNATNTITWVISLNDGNWKYTSLLLSGSTPTTTFINDASLNNNQLTITGDTRPNKFNPYQESYYSTYFNGTDSLLSIPNNAAFNFGTGDFTIEWWQYLPGTFGTQNGMEMGQRLGTGNGWVIFRNTSVNTTKYSFRTEIDTDYVSTVTPASNVWEHWALVRSSSTLTWYCNGVACGATAGMSTNISDASGLMYIGRAQQWGTLQGAGYFSNLRIVKGTALYTSNFTPSSTALASIAGTSLLALQSSMLVEKSSNNFTITRTGTTKISSVVPFASISSYSTYGSAYFDGTGDNLTVPSSSTFSCGTGDFTVEAWFYITAAGNNYKVILQSYDGTYGPTIRFGDDGFGNKLQVAVTPSSTATVYSCSLTQAQALNQWYHVALVRQSGSGRLYLNGVLQSLGSGANPASYPSSSFTSAESVGNNSPKIGGDAFTGYISDARIIRGTALYTANFLPPQAPLTPVTNTQLLTLQYNGGANNNGFVDQSSFNNIITRAGNTTQGTFSPYSQTGWSTQFSGTLTTGISSSTILPATTTTFTIEAWIYMTATPVQSSGSVPAPIFADCSGVTNYLTFGVWNNNTLAFMWYDSAVKTLAGNTVMSLNTWYHVAVVSSSNTLKLYVNGNAETLTGTSTLTNRGGVSGAYQVSAYNGAAAAFTGLISNLRVVTDTAVYPGTFTPSNTPLTAIQNTKLLAFQSNRIIDNSANNYAFISSSPPPSVQAFSPFGSVTSVPTSYSLLQNIDGSVQFDRISTNTKTDLGSGAFTVEGWFYPTASMASKNTRIISLGRDSAGTNTSWDLYISNGTSIVWNRINTTATTYSASYTFNLNTWYHVAVCRDGANNLAIFVNGTRVLAQANETTSYDYVPISISNHYVGASYNGTTWSFGRGYYSNIRVIKSATAYDPTQSNITVPTAQLSITANTSVLLFASRICEDSTGVYAVDNSTQNYPIRAFNPFGITNLTSVAYSPSSHGGSMYFDGTGDYLTVAGGTPLALGTRDFTIQFWAYLSVAPTTDVMFYDGRNGANGVYPLIYWRLSAAKMYYLVNSVDAIISNTVTAASLVGTWTHFAVVRKSSVTKMFINGVQAGSDYADTNDYLNSGNYPSIGASSTVAGGYVNGYMSDVQVVKGAALYNSTFYPGTTPATPTNTTTLLLTGTSGGIIDYHSTSDFETLGNTQPVSEDPYGGSNYSNYFDGTGDYLSLASAVVAATGDFTIEGWVNIGGLGTRRDIIYQNSPSASSEGRLVINVNINGTVAAFVGGTTGAPGSIASTTALVPGSWYHIAYVRNSNTFSLYVNGVQEGTQPTGTISIVQQPVLIGNNPVQVPATYWFGNLSNIRIVNGTALYTANFTPSTTPLTAISGTGLLTCQSNKFKDNSANNYTITVSGDAKVKSMNPFQRSTRKSLYFDGTGDYLKSYNVATIRFDAGNFTIEFWMYPTLLGSAMVILSSADTGAQGGAVDIRTDYIGATSTLIYFSGGGADAWTTYNGALINRWTHMAFVRNGATVTLYVNGTSAGTMAAGTQGTTSFTAVNIGGGSGAAASGYATFQGYLSDFRVTKGVARYTTTFTPPSIPLKTK